LIQLLRIKPLHHIIHSLAAHDGGQEGKAEEVQRRDSLHDDGKVEAKKVSPPFRKPIFEVIKDRL